MIRFGPSGNSESFYAQGHKHTVEAFAWIREKDLEAYEYSFGRGVRMKQETAQTIGQAAADEDVALSVHAPYYINFATEDEEKAVNNLRYIREAAQAAKWMGATRVVFHAGTQGKLQRGQAFERIHSVLKLAVQHLKNEDLWDVAICPETMGKIKQIGDLDEVIGLCKIDERIIPAIDFGHMHARTKGGIKGEEEYAAILDQIENELGGYRAKQFHVHFSKIEYTAAGERRHRTFADTEYGPDFRPLARLIAQRGLEPRMICESKGTMAEDAAEMKRIYLEELERI